MQLLGNDFPVSRDKKAQCEGGGALTMELAEIRTLEAFIAVADAESFGQAASRLGLTRSTIGKSVARLEHLLGVRLLHRTTRRVGLTVDGRAFYERALIIIKDLEDAQKTITRTRAVPGGTLRITMTEAFGRQIVLPVLADYLEQWPGLSVETSFTDRFIDLVEEGFDLAIRFGPPPANSELISRVIARSFGQLCAAPSYLESHGMPMSPEDLARHKKLVFNTYLRPRSMWQLTKVQGIPEIIQGSPTMLSDNASALLDAAKAGLGITCLPRFLIQPALATGHLQILLPEYSSPEIPISVVYPSKRYLTPKVSVFINLLLQRTDNLLL